MRRSFQAEAATGMREALSAAIVRSEKIATQFANQPIFRQEVPQAAVANQNAFPQRLKRVHVKHFPTVNSFKELNDEENFSLTCTLRGSISGGHNFGEIFSLYADNDILIFTSPRNLFHLRHSRDLVCDGTLKYRVSVQISEARSIKKFGENHETLDKVETLIRYFREQCIELGEFFSLHGMVGPKTTNTAEPYHGKQLHYFQKHCKLGEFIVCLNELHNAEEENASYVHHNRQRPRHQSKQSAVNAEKISIAQAGFDSFLSGNVSLAEIQVKLAEFIIHVGHQMGYNGNAYWEQDGDEEMENAALEKSSRIFDPDPLHILRTEVSQCIYRFAKI
uniref:Uncharacterized protein n=1 Tax=Ditylenchus dipsaci TaxID=166011 RepID=A0A915DIE0_9BILA